MVGLGIGLLVAAALMTPFAIFVLWRSAQRVEEEQLEPVFAEVDRNVLADRLNRGLDSGQEQVRQREKTGDTPMPTFYRGRSRVVLEREEPRKYM